MRPLTAMELRERTAELFKRCVADGGDPEDVIFEVIVCDGCQLTHDRIKDGDPVGWTTEGDRATGYVDLCGACSE